MNITNVHNMLIILILLECVYLNGIKESWKMINWCPGRDLNSHDRKGRGILNPLCLPISPPGLDAIICDVIIASNAVHYTYLNF